MRWGDLFDHLEADVLAGGDVAKNPAITEIRDSSPLLATLADAKRRKTTVTLGLVTGRVVHLAPKSVGRDWFSGEVGGEDGSGLLIPLHSVAWLTSAGNTDTSSAMPAAIAVTEVLVDLARRRVSIACELQGGEISGELTTVGGSWFEVIGPGGTPLHRRRVNLSAVIAIRYGTRTWG